MKAVFFDLDDTLYGSFAQCDAAAMQAVGWYAERELGIAGDAFEQEFWRARKSFARAQPGMPPIHDRVLVAQRALERFGANAIRHSAAMHEAYWNAVYENMQIREGVREHLRTLRQRGIKTAVCTDMMADVQMQKLIQLGIADDIDYLISSEEAGQDKPSPPIFWLALQKCGCLPQDAVMVGDNFVHDVQGALDCGMHGVWLNWNAREMPEEDRDFYVATTFAEAASYIEAHL